jgi:hypothetical protein
MPDPMRRWGALCLRQHTDGIRRAGYILDDNDALRIYRQDALIICRLSTCCPTVPCMWLQLRCQSRTSSLRRLRCACKRLLPCHFINSVIIEVVPYVVFSKNRVLNHVDEVHI